MKVSKVDVFVDLQANSRSILLSLLMLFSQRMRISRYRKYSGAKSRIVMLNRFLGRNDFYLKCRNYRQESIALLMHKTIKHALKTDELIDIKRQNTIEFPSQLGRSKSVLLMAPGGSHAVKHIPPSLIVDVLLKLPDAVRSNLLVQLVGDQNDAALCESVESKIAHLLEVENLSGENSLIELIPIIAKADIVLSSDSAIAHLAKFINIPVIIILGPTIAGFGYAIEDSRTHVFEGTLSCRPCSRHGARNCRYKDKKCFELINTSVVSDKIGQYIIKPASAI